MTTTPPDSPFRLIDLAVEWPLQYAEESTLFPPDAYPGVRGRLGQVDGYLSSTAAALVWFGPTLGDRSDPWSEVSTLLTRIEAEFAGRLLIGPDDLNRFDAEPPDGMTWAVASLRGCGSLMRSAEDVDRLAALFSRGIRAFRLAGLVDRPAPGEAGSGLTDLERKTLDSLFALARKSGRPGLLIDLAGLSPRAAGEVLDRFDRDDAPDSQAVPMLSLAGPDVEAVRHLRALGGFVGVGVGRSFFLNADALTGAVEAIAALPFRDRPGFEGIGIGSGFLGIDEAIAGLGTADAILAWLSARFGEESARQLARGNARSVIEHVVGSR